MAKGANVHSRPPSGTSHVSCSRRTIGVATVPDPPCCASLTAQITRLRELRQELWSELFTSSDRRMARPPATASARCWESAQLSTLPWQCVIGCQMSCFSTGVRKRSSLSSRPILSPNVTRSRTPLPYAFLIVTGRGTSQDAARGAHEAEVHSGPCVSHK